jgi:hypothetical protein
VSTDGRTDGRTVFFDSWVGCHHGKMQYFLPFEKKAINKLIEQAILEAENEGARVLGLGALNKVFRFFRPFLLVSRLRYSALFYSLQKVSLQITVLELNFFLKNKNEKIIFFLKKKFRSTKTLVNRVKEKLINR